MRRSSARFGELEGWIKDHLIAAFYSSIDEHLAAKMAPRDLAKLLPILGHGACPGSTFIGLLPSLAATISTVLQK